MNVNERIAAVRALMAEKGIDVYYIPNEDDHLSQEYTAAYFQCKSWISGFSGEAGCVILTKDFAGLWTDGRYFTQAENELKGLGDALSLEKNNYYLRQALMGHGWAEGYVKEHRNFCDQAIEGLKKEMSEEAPITERQIIVAMQKGRYPMPPNPSAEVFNEGVLRFLNVIGSDLSVQDVRAMRVSPKASTNLDAEQIQHLIQNRGPQP